MAMLASTPNMQEQGTEAATTPLPVVDEASIFPNGATCSVMNGMMEVEMQVSDFDRFLRSQVKHDKPLVEWRQYDRYPAFARAILELGIAVGTLREVGHQNKFGVSIESLLKMARGISISVSDSTVSTLEIMNKSTAAYMEGIKAREVPSEASLDGAKTRRTVFRGLSQLLQHSTSATSSIWYAMDTLDKVFNTDAPISQIIESQDDKHGGVEKSTGEEIPLSKSNEGEKITGKKEQLLMKSAMKDWKQWLIVSLLLLTWGMLSYPYIAGTASGAQTCASSNANHMLALQLDDHASYQETIYNLVHAQHHQSNLTTLLLHDVKQRFDDTSSRIDNVWESLGPPNKLGTYYESSDPGRLDRHVQRKMSEIHKHIEVSSKQLKAEIERVRYEWLRGEIRLNGRMDKLERESR